MGRLEIALNLSIAHYSFTGYFGLFAIIRFYFTTVANILPSRPTREGGLGALTADGFTKN